MRPLGVCHHLGIELTFAIPKNAKTKIAERTFATLSRVIDDRPEFKGAHAGHAPGAAPDRGVVPVPLAVATRKGYLSPAMQDWAMALCRSDEASFDAFIAKAAPAFAHITAESHLRGVPPHRGKTVQASAEAEALCAQLGLDPSALAD